MRMVIFTRGVWGENFYGRLGVNLDTSYVTVPALIANPPGVNGWKSLSFGRDATGLITFGITDDNQLYEWGDGCWMADGTKNTKETTPTRVKLPPGTTGVVTAFSGGAFVMQTTDCRVWSWGRAAWGNLGIGPNAHDSTVPVYVSTFPCSTASVAAYSPSLIGSAWITRTPGTATLHFTTPIGCRLSYSVCDVLGRELQGSTERLYDAGTHLENIQTQGLRSGSYFVRISSQSALPRTLRLAVVR